MELCKIAFWIWISFICMHAAAKRIQLRDVCESPDDSDTLICKWQTVGEYVSDGVNQEVRRVEFDRLTNSVVNFRNLMNANTLEIQSKFLDTYTECQHVVGNVQAISVEVERQPSVSCIPAHSTNSDTSARAATTGTSIRAVATPSTRTAGPTAVKEPEPATTMDSDVWPSGTTVDNTDTMTFPATLEKPLTFWISIALGSALLVVIVVITALVCRRRLKCCARQQRIERLSGSILDLHASEETIFACTPEATKSKVL